MVSLVGFASVVHQKPIDPSLYFKEMSDKPLLILDLDETLVHATPILLDVPPALKVHDLYVYQRPGFAYFMRQVMRDFNVAVWTSASALYAQRVVSSLWPDASQLAFVWSHLHCTRRYDYELMSPYWIKKLNKVKRRGYDIHRVLAVDNTPRKWEQSYGNLIAVPDWCGAQDDEVLFRLWRYLDHLRDVPDVRAVDKRHWLSRW